MSRRHFRSQSRKFFKYLLLPPVILKVLEVLILQSTVLTVLTSANVLPKANLTNYVYCTKKEKRHKIKLLLEHRLITVRTVAAVVASRMEVPNFS